MGVLKEKVGGIWTPVGLDGFAAMARGMIGYAEKVSTQTGITVDVDVSGLVVTVTVPGGRRIRVRASGIFVNATANCGVVVGVWEGTAALIERDHLGTGVASRRTTWNVDVILTPTAGVHSYKIRAREHWGGPVSIEASALTPSTLVVEDMGPVFPSTWNDSYSAIPNVAGYTQTTVGQGGITGTEVDLTNLAVTITAAPDHRYRISAFVRASSSVANDSVDMGIFEGTTRFFSAPTTLPVAARPETLSASAIITPTAGTHTYKLRMARYAGTGTVSLDVSATTPLWIMVEDLGSIYGSFGADKQFIQPHCRVHRAAAFTVPNGSETVIPWDTQYQSNDSGIWSSSLNPGRMKATKAGLWLYHSSLSIQGPPGNARYANFTYLNGTVQIVTDDEETPISVGAVTRKVSLALNLAVNDYLESRGYVFNPGSRTLNTGVGLSWASMTYLGPFA